MIALQQEVGNVCPRWAEELCAFSAGCFLIHRLNDRIVFGEASRNNRLEAVQVLALQLERQRDHAHDGFVEGERRTPLIDERCICDLEKRVALLLALSLGSGRKGTKRSKGNRQSSHHPLPLLIEGLQPNRVRWSEQAGYA